LSFGQQAVQAMHALRQFVHDHSEVDRCWFEQSNYIGLLSVNNENDLYRLIETAEQRNIRFSIFKEPDIGNQITAIALEPCKESKKMCSQLKLALKS